MKKIMIAMVMCICALGVSGCERQDSFDSIQSEPGATEGASTEEVSPKGPSLESGNKENSLETAENGADTQNLTYEEMMDQFYEKFYAGLSQEEIEQRITEGISYYQASKYYGEVTNYWENIRGVTDISNVIEPLYFTDMKYYREEDFQNDPKIIIHLAKNEIYARHGYIFKDEDLYSYFMGCAWYRPAVAGEEFDDAVFNDYERKNLELLAAMDREPEQ